MSDFCTTGELLKLPNQTWLIKGLVPESGLSLLFGPSGEGKSFVAIDWACCVSTGTPWLNQHRVKQGHVLYIAAEGGAGIKKRVAAWMQYNGFAKLPNITWFLNSLDFSEEGAMDDFKEALEQRFSTEAVYGEDGEVIAEATFVNIRLVVVDTLSRCFGGADENASTAMPVFIDLVEKFCRQHGAAGLIIHHANATGSRERGHTSLKAATEAAFHCTASKENARLNTITLVNIKQKDDIDGAETLLKPLCLELPELPRDEDGSVLTSLVLEQTAHDEAGGEVRDSIMQHLDGKPPISKSALGNLVYKDVGGGRNNIRRVISKMVDDGTLVASRGDELNAWLVSLKESSERKEKHY